MNVEPIWEAPPPKQQTGRLGGERARWFAGSDPKRYDLYARYVGQDGAT